MRLASSAVKRLLAVGRRAGSSAAGVSLEARYLPPAEDSNRAGLALSIPKRLLKRAVDRNKVKRIVKEAYRQHPVRHQGSEVMITLKAAISPSRSRPGSRAALAQATRTSANALLTKLLANPRQS